ncbi:F-box only protein 38-like isoform X2 [Limulus polyphemus]|nr:F-box only protein 38-like isoform X2 [Limulus polyphemus]
MVVFTKQLDMEGKNNQIELTCLSHELLCHVIDYLPLKEVLSLVLLCKKLQDAVALHLKLCKTIDLAEREVFGYMPATITDDHLHALLQKCPQLEVVYGLHPWKVERRRQRKQPTLTVQGIMKALSLCPNLSGVETSDLRVAEAVLHHMPQVEILGHFQNRTGDFPPRSSSKFKFPAYPHISSLHLSGVEVPELTVMPQVEHMYLHGVRFTKINPFRGFVAPSLRTFVMRHCMGPSVALRYLPLVVTLSSATFLSRLELVRVPILGGLIQRAVEDSWRNGGFRRLRTLVIGGCKNILESDIGHLIIVASGNLENLAIQPSLTKDTLFVALSCAQGDFSRLQSLHLGYVEELPSKGEWSEERLLSMGLAEFPDVPSPLTDTGMKVIGQLFPSLKFLTVNNCPHLLAPDTWSPNNGQNWTNLTDLILRRCHCLRLLSFALFLALLPAIETVFLEDMFREPPKGCNHVGLSAGTGLGMSSAVMSNQEDEVNVQAEQDGLEDRPLQADDNQPGEEHRQAVPQVNPNANNVLPEEIHENNFAPEPQANNDEAHLINVWLNEDRREMDSGNGAQPAVDGVAEEPANNGVTERFWYHSAEVSQHHVVNGASQAHAAGATENICMQFSAQNHHHQQADHNEGKENFTGAYKSQNHIIDGNEVSHPHLPETSKHMNTHPETEHYNGMSQQSVSRQLQTKEQNSNFKINQDNSKVQDDQWLAIPGPSRESYPLLLGSTSSKDTRELEVHNDFKKPPSTTQEGFASNESTSVGEKPKSNVPSNYLSSKGKRSSRKTSSGHAVQEQNPTPMKSSPNAQHKDMKVAESSSVLVSGEFSQKKSHGRTPSKKKISPEAKEEFTKEKLLSTDKNKTIANTSCCDGRQQYGSFISEAEEHNSTKSISSTNRKTRYLASCGVPQVSPMHQPETSQACSFSELPKQNLETLNVSSLDASTSFNSKYEKCRSTNNKLGESSQELAGPVDWNDCSDSNSHDPPCVPSCSRTSITPNNCTGIQEQDYSSFSNHKATENFVDRKNAFVDNQETGCSSVRRRKRKLAADNQNENVDNNDQTYTSTAGSYSSLDSGKSAKSCVVLSTRSSTSRQSRSCVSEASSNLQVADVSTNSFSVKIPNIKDFTQKPKSSRNKRKQKLPPTQKNDSSFFEGPMTRQRKRKMSDTGTVRLHDVACQASSESIRQAPGRSGATGSNITSDGFRIIRPTQHSTSTLRGSRVTRATKRKQCDPPVSKSKGEKPNCADKATSTSDPLLEDDPVLIFRVVSETLHSLTVVSCGISDIIMDLCPRLLHLEVNACRILKRIYLRSCPMLIRLNLSQCPKLSLSCLTSEIINLPTKRGRLVYLEPCNEKYDRQEL